MADETQTVAWVCAWCRERIEFAIRLGATTTALVDHEVTCSGCGARNGLELQASPVGVRLLYKRVAHGRAGRIDIRQIEDALTVSLVDRPLMSGDELDLRRHGAWVRGEFDWDEAGEGTASLTIGGATTLLDPAIDLLRWTT